MQSVFNSKNADSFVIAKSILERNDIPFIPKGDNLAGLEYTQFELLVKESDYDKAIVLLSDVKDSVTELQNKFDKKHRPFFGYILILGILATVAVLFLLGLWIRK